MKSDREDFSNQVSRTRNLFNKKSQTFCIGLGAPGLCKKLGLFLRKFCQLGKDFFSFFFATTVSSLTYLPHGPYLFFLAFFNLAGIPRTSFSKYEYSSPGPFKLKECRIWETLCRNCATEMMWSCFKSSNSLLPNSFLNADQTVSMGLKSGLAGGNLMAVILCLRYSQHHNKQKHPPNNKKT